MREKRLTDFLVRFGCALERQLESDEERWGDTWKKRPREGQEERVYSRFGEYYREWKVNGIRIPWLKIAGLAMICWVRETFPEYSSGGQE